MAALSMEEFRDRKARSALMFAERSLSDARASYDAEPGGPLASAIGHLSLAVVDLREQMEEVVTR